MNAPRTLERPKSMSYICECFPLDRRCDLEKRQTDINFHFVYEYQLQSDCYQRNEIEVHVVIIFAMTEHVMCAELCGGRVEILSLKDDS